MGECLEKLDSFSEAGECFDKAVVANPKNMMGWVKRAINLGLFGKLTEAMACVQKAHELGYPNAPKLAAIIREKCQT